MTLVLLIFASATNKAAIRPSSLMRYSKVPRPRERRSSKPKLHTYMVKQTTAASLAEIGRLFGGRHHTTVLHSIRKIDGMRKSDEALNHLIMQSMDAVAN